MLGEIRYASNFPTVVKKGLRKLQRATQFFRKQFYRPPTTICWFRQPTFNLINFPKGGQTGSVIPAVSNELWHCICLVLGGKAFTVLVFRALGFSATDYGMIQRLRPQRSLHSTLCGQREVIFRTTHSGYTHKVYGLLREHSIKRSNGHKRYYSPQFKHRHK